MRSSLPAGWLYKPGEAVQPPPYGGRPGPNQTNGPSKGLFYPVMKNWSMYMCPLHQTNTAAWKQSNIKFTSYLMNGVVINGSGSFDWGAGAIAHATADYGSKFMIVAGMLNLITVADAYHIAIGKKL